jgi:hypothetical protein
MESARTGPHYADGLGDQFIGQADGASLCSCAIMGGSLAIRWGVKLLGYIACSTGRAG